MIYQLERNPLCDDQKCDPATVSFQAQHLLLEFSGVRACVSAFYVVAIGSGATPYRDHRELQLKRLDLHSDCFRESLGKEAHRYCGSTGGFVSAASILWRR